MIAHILTEEEYEALLTVQSKPDELLRETNKQLKSKLDEAEAKLKQGSFDNIKLDSPFLVVNSKLCLRSATDFIVMYNNVAASTLTQSDLVMFTQLTDVAKFFNLECQFADTKQLKAHRVSLQKKNLCTPIKVDGRNYLQINKD
jgi:hypothetical protein